jgi:MoxR-like ATPase
MDPKLQSVLNILNTAVLGKQHQLKLAFSCMLAQGHLLIEDLPGMGKTTLSHALANVLGLQYQRIQFTSDMLPADIIGSSVFQQQTASADAGFVLHKGPVFSQLVLADEINRATPKTQSALLEAMEEHQVSIDGQTYELPSPFFVIATQNPASQSGTFTLPESQLDRFLMRIKLGYPSEQAERMLLEGKKTTLSPVDQVMSQEHFVSLQAQVKDVFASESLLDYLQRLVKATREHPQLQYGLSPRGALALLNGAKAWALLEGRDHVLPDDVQAVFLPVVEHRLTSAMGQYDAQLCESLLQNVPVL